MPEYVELSIKTESLLASETTHFPDGSYGIHMQGPETNIVWHLPAPVMEHFGRMIDNAVINSLESNGD